MEIIKDRSNRSQEVYLIHVNTENQLQKEIQKCLESNSCYTIASGKTSLTGGCIPLEKKEIVLDVSYINSLSRKYNQFTSVIQNDYKFCINIDDNMAIFPCGIPINILDDILSTYNMFYPPTPGYKKCTLGGTVATNASGPRTFSFGATRENIFFIRLVLPDGEICEITRGDYISQGENFIIKNIKGKTYEIPIPRYKWNNIKNVTGIYSHIPLDLIDLFIGSEGVLGVITDIGIVLKEIQEPIESKIYFFDNQNRAIEAAFDAKNRKEEHISVEFIDKNAIKLSGIQKYFEYQAAVELEYYSSNASKIDDWKDKFSVNYTMGGEEVAPFRYGIPLNMSEILRKNNTIKLGTDFAVQDDIFLEILTLYFNTMDEYHSVCGSPKYITSAMWGHFGNNHLHINFLPNSAEAQDYANKKYKELAKYIVEQGGVIMAEHGVGKKQFYDGTGVLDVQNKKLKLEITRIKKILDPNLLLNRGNYGIV